MRDSQLDMDQLSAHGMYVHLYVNGLYWGLYNPTERPDDAFHEIYQGDREEDWDVVKDFSEMLKPFKKDGFFPPFPFGTDFTDEELAIGKALKGLKARMARGGAKVSSLSKAAVTFSVPEEAQPYLARLDLDEVKGGKERMMRNLVVHALRTSGVIGA